MSTDARWSDETERLVALLITDDPQDCEPARSVLAALADARLLLPPEAICRVERGEVYLDGHRIGMDAIRTVWETPWQPAPLPEWERELLESEDRA